MKKTLQLITLFFACQLQAQCWQSVSAGGDKTIALSVTGKIFGWGDNSSGALGLGAFSGAQFNPTASSNGNTFTQVVSGGNAFTIALKSDGTLWSTGINTSGFLGIGNYTNKNTFTQIGVDSNWQSVSAGGSHVLAIKTDGTLWAWGANTEGQLGNGTTTMSNVPIQIGSDTNWQSVAAGGYYFSAAIKTNGTLWVWGNDSYGQLGNGIVTNHTSIPVQIGTDTNWNKISAGQYHVLALKNNGSLWGWGDNSAGNIGIGSTTPVYVPTQIGIETDWQKISASTFASYAIKSNGTLWSWGYNSNGQLGDGTTVQKNIPTQVGSGTTWQFISGSLGYYYAVGIKNDGSLWSWGINNFGVLGDGTSIQRVSPTAVNCPASLSLDNFNTQIIAVYPNPNQGVFSILNHENIKQITVSDVLGKQVTVNKLANNQFEVLHKGVFIVKIWLENDQILFKKIVIN